MPSFNVSDDVTPESIEKKIPKGVPQNGMDLIAEARAELAEREKKIAPPMISEPRCLVCQHDYRTFIEAMIVKAQSYKSIAERVPLPEGSSVDSFRRSMSNHYKKHMALEDAAIRAILEEESDLAGQNYEEGVRGAITARGILEVALRKGYNDIVNGISEIPLKDMIQAMKLLREMDAATSDTQVAHYEMQARIFTQAIRDVLGNREDGQEIMNAIVARIEVLKREDAIEAAIESELVSPRRIGIPETVEAEVVED